MPPVVDSSLGWIRSPFVQFPATSIHLLYFNIQAIFMGIHCVYKNNFL